MMKNKILRLFLIIALLTPIFPTYLISKGSNNNVLAETSVNRIELTELRTKNSKTFQVADNEFVMEESTDNIHYGKKGDFKEINNNFIAAGDVDIKFQNAANDFSFKASSRIQGGVKYQDSLTDCRFAFLGNNQTEPNNSEGYIDQNKLIYPDVYPYTDIVFTLLSTGIKSEILVKRIDSLFQSYSFDISGCPNNPFDAPVMNDNDKMVQISAEKKDIEGTSKLIIRPNYEDLGTIDGVVYIDPSITKPSNIDVFTSQYMPNGHSRRFLAFGRFIDRTNGVYIGNSEAYFKFHADLPIGSIVNEAKLSVRRYANGGAGFNASAARILSNNLSNSTGRYTNDWKSKGEIFDTLYIDSGDWDFKEYNFNVTQLAAGWVNGSYPNYGVAIYSNNPPRYAGAAICSSRSDGFCTDAHDPKLQITYTLNLPPNTPNPLLPENQKTFSGYCNESVVPTEGICRNSLITNFKLAGIGDPNPAPGHLKHTIIYLRSVINFQTNPIIGSGSLEHKEQLNDGTYYWKARSIDNLGLWGVYSPEFVFTIDTTPPEIPSMLPLDEYTSVNPNTTKPQIEITGTPVEDNISNPEQISYSLEYSTNESFTENSFQKPWQLNNVIFEIGESGADNSSGTDDDLKENELYFFRINAKDHLGNISSWSNVESTIIDSTSPEVENLSVSLNRFSPNNPTSKDNKDLVQIYLSVKESNLQSAALHIKDVSGNIVNILTISPDIKKEENNFIFQWEGKDQNDTFVNDGGYQIVPVVTDIAGNINKPFSSELVIVDNNDANITISLPLDNFWTNRDNIDIKGQVKAPNDPGEEDQDLEQFNISNDKINWQEISYDSYGFFDINQEINNDQTTFTLKTLDTVGNTQTKDITINKDTTPPEIFNVLPNGMINNRRPEISFSVSDTKSKIPLDLDASSISISLEYLLINTDGNKLLAEKSLIEKGINLNSELISELDCKAQNAEIDTVVNGLHSTETIICSIQFISDLQPDSNYKIIIKVKDNAGNPGINDENQFVLDTHIFNELTSPIQSSLHSNSYVYFSGKVSKDSKLVIQHKTLDLQASIDFSSNNIIINNESGLFQSDPIVKCNIFVDIDNRQNTPDEEVCEWNAYLKQHFSISDENTSNEILFTAIDGSGNNEIIEFSLDVNIHSFNVAITSDVKYFSPNGDGNQDGLVFSHTVSNNADPNNQPRISNYSIIINDTSGEVIWQSSGDKYLPMTTFFEGKNINSNWLNDGEYTFSLYLKTEDSIDYSTKPQSIFAVTKLLKDVFITSPKDGDITTNGVIHVKGQAPYDQSLEGLIPFFRGQVTIKICIDTISNSEVSINCEHFEKTGADQNGYFSTLVLLPRIKGQSKSKHEIYAYAYDSFGNQTGRSNLVTIIQDVTKPFNSVSISPVITSPSNITSYEGYLNKELTVNDVRAVLLQANVTENTELLEISFSLDTTTSNVESEYSKSNYIATINNRSETSRLLNPDNNPSVKFNYKIPINDYDIQSANCDNSFNGCNWHIYLPIPPDFSGIYNINFKALKGDLIEEVSAGFKVDSTISVTPSLTLIEKRLDARDLWVPIIPISGVYYSNTKNIRLRGFAEPNSNLLIKISDNIEDETWSSPTGIWAKEITLVTDLNENDKLKCIHVYETICKEFSSTIEIELLKNEKHVSSAIKTLVFDTNPPDVNSIYKIMPQNTLDDFLKTGDRVGYSITSTERLFYADIIKEDDYLRSLLNIHDNFLWIAHINVDRKSEGKYSPSLQLSDFAGNINVITSDDLNVIIDNTTPDSQQMETSSWETQGGVRAVNPDPVYGRLSPEFITRSSNFTITGLAEKNQRVSININNQHYKDIFVPGTSCIRYSEDNLSVDRSIVKYGDICKFLISVNFNRNGLNHLMGIPTEYNVIQFQVIDKAGNKSMFSKQQIIYHDTNPPQTPQFNSAKV